MEHTQDIELSLIILCYRSESFILSFARKAKAILDEIAPSYEIVLVGNYIENSGDKTIEFIQQLEKESPVFRGIYKPKLGMMGWDMREGLNHARGKYLCVIDGDGQFPIESISLCYEAIKTNKYGLVKTFRTTREDGFYRNAISYGFNMLFNILFPKINSKDINSKPKMLTRACFEQLDLKSDDWFIDAEIMINIGKLKIPFIELPVTFLKLQDRKSFVKPSAIIEFIKNLIAFRFK